MPRGNMPHDATWGSDSVGIASIRSVFLRSVSRPNAHSHVSMLTLGHSLIFYSRIHISGDSHDSVFATAIVAFSSSSLLSHLCKPSPQRLLNQLCMDVGSGSVQLFASSNHGVATLPHSISKIQISKVTTHTPI